MRQIEFCRIADVQADGTLLERATALAEQLTQLRTVVAEVRDVLREGNVYTYWRMGQLAAKLDEALAEQGTGDDKG